MKVIISQLRKPDEQYAALPQFKNDSYDETCIDEMIAPDVGYQVCAVYLVPDAAATS